MQIAVLLLVDDHLYQSSYAASIDVLIDDNDLGLAQDVLDSNALHHDASQLNVAFPENSFGRNVSG